MKKRDNDSGDKRLLRKKLQTKLQQARKERKRLVEKTEETQLELEKEQALKIDKEINKEIFEKPENTERSKVEAEILNLQARNVMYIHALNGTEYDGRVIKGEEALEKLESFLAQRTHQESEEIQIIDNSKKNVLKEESSGFESNNYQMTETKSKKNKNTKNIKASDDQVSSDLVTSPRNITGEPSPPEQALHERGTGSSHPDTDTHSLNKAVEILLAAPVLDKEETSARVSDKKETEHDEEKVEEFVTVVVLDKVETATDQVSEQLEVDEDRADEIVSVVKVLPSVPMLEKEENLITTDQVSDQLEVDEDRGDEIVSVVEVFPSVPVLDKVEITTDQVSDQLEVDEDRGDEIVSVVEVLPSVPVLDKEKITTDQVSDQLEVDEDRGDEIVSMVEVLPSVPVLDKVEITTDEVSDQLEVDEERADGIIVSMVEVLPSVPVLDNLEITTDEVSDQLEVDEDRTDEIVSVVEVLPSVPVLEKVEITTDQVSNQLKVDEDRADEFVSVVPFAPVLDNLEIKTDQVSDQLTVDEDRVEEMVSLEVLPTVPVVDKAEITTNQLSDQVEVEEESLLTSGSLESLIRALDQLEMENETDPMFSELEGDQGFVCESTTVECFTPSLSKGMENTRDQVSCRLEVDEESLFETGFDKIEDTAEPGSSYFIETKTDEPTTPCQFSKAIENTTDQVSRQLEDDGESLFETGITESLIACFDEIEDTGEPGSSYFIEIKTVEPTTPCLFSKGIENTIDKVSCQLEADGESLFVNRSIESLMGGFDEIEDTAEPGSSNFIETKTLEPTTPCLFSKEVEDEREPGQGLADVDEENLKEIILVDPYTCGAVVDETENDTEDDMVKSSDSMNNISQLSEHIKVVQQQLYEKEVTIQTQGKKLEKLTKALGEMESQQYQKDATIKAQKEEIDELRANLIHRSSGPSKVNQIFQFVQCVGFHVGSTIVKYNIISHM